MKMSRGFSWDWLPQMVVGAAVFLGGLWVQSEVMKVKLDSSETLNTREHAAIMARMDRYEVRLNELSARH